MFIFFLVVRTPTDAFGGYQYCIPVAQPLSGVREAGLVYPVYNQYLSPGGPSPKYPERSGGLKSYKCGDKPGGPGPLKVDTKCAWCTGYEEAG